MRITFWLQKPMLNIFASTGDNSAASLVQPWSVKCAAAAQHLRKCEEDEGETKLHLSRQAQTNIT